MKNKIQVFLRILLALHTKNLLNNLSALLLYKKRDSSQEHCARNVRKTTFFNLTPSPSPIYKRGVNTINFGGL